MKDEKENMPLVDRVVIVVEVHMARLPAALKTFEHDFGDIKALRSQSRRSILPELHSDLLSRRASSLRRLYFCSGRRNR